MTLTQRPASAILLVGLFWLGCSPKRDASLPARLSQGAASSPVTDTKACAQICDASAACGDTEERCLTRCTEWLVKRSRPGIASATARCAVPRIDDACGTDAARGAARALVSCVDEAGRTALVSDKKTLFVAARAICERGARCQGGSPTDANSCIQRIVNAPAAPKGLGIFGAIKPTLVTEFATCLQTSGCGQAGAVCFGSMLGETGVEGPDDDEAPSVPPPEQPAPTTAPAGTKI